MVFFTGPVGVSFIIAQVSPSPPPKGVCITQKVIDRFWRQNNHEELPLQSAMPFRLEPQFLGGAEKEWGGGKSDQRSRDQELGLLIPVFSSSQKLVEHFQRTDIPIKDPKCQSFHQPKRKKRKQQTWQCHTPLAVFSRGGKYTKLSFLITTQSYFPCQRSSSKRVFSLIPRVKSVS